MAKDPEHQQPTGPVDTLAAAAPVRAWPASAEQLPSSAEYQRLLQSYAVLEEENRRRTVALATAAHELKTPLAIIAGYLELLLADKFGELSPRQRQVLEDIRSNGARLQHFIQDFLTYSALETGNVGLRFEEADLNVVLSEVCSFWLQRFHDHQVALYFLANEKLKPFPFDNFKLQHIVSNLLDNALKYAPAGGTVWLSAEPHLWERRTPGNRTPVLRERRRRPLESANAVRVSVADTGPGIAPEFHQEVFEDFYKAPTNGSKPDGMGLGLAIARRLVLAHGGRIWVEGEPGTGCKFSFLIPTTPANATEPS